MDVKDLAKDSYEKAMRYMSTNKGRAFAHYLVSLTLCPEWKPQMLESFIELTENVAGGMLKYGRVEDFFKCYEGALELYPDSPILKRFFAKHLLSIGLPFRAFNFYRAAYIMAPEVPLWQKELDNLKDTLVSRWHFRMLNDRVRNEAYREAILSTISSHHSVLDIGCGSGILSLFAAEAKPQRIFAVESNEALYNVALNVFKENNISNVQLIHEMSTSLKQFDKVSAVITETFDAGFFGEGILQTMAHARKYLMLNSPKDIIIPKSGSIYICGVQSESLAKNHIVVCDHLKDIKMHQLKIHADDSQEPYDTEDLTLFTDLLYVTDVKKMIDVNFYDAQNLEELYTGEKKIEPIYLKSNCNANIHAYVVWFSLNLTDGITITNDPRSVNRCNAWEHAVFYLNTPKVVKHDDEFVINMSCESGKLQLLKSGLAETEGDFVMRPSIIKMLNDSVLIHASDSAASAACVHLAQAYSFQDIHVLDLSPFPITGLLLLSRGVQYLTCLSRSDDEKRLILRICELNGISADRIYFYQRYRQVLENEGKKYHVIISNFFNEMYGELNIRRIVRARGFTTFNKLEKHGLTMPQRIKLMGKLVYCSEFERINKVDDDNVVGYKIAEFMNLYSVRQNFFDDITKISYITMSEDLVLLDYCIKKCEENMLNIQLLKDGQVNAVICWFEVQMMENGDFYSTKVSGSWSVCSVHLLETSLSGVAEQKGSLLLRCDENGYLRIAVDLD